MVSELVRDHQQQAHQYSKEKHELPEIDHALGSAAFTKRSD